MGWNDKSIDSTIKDIMAATGFSQQRRVVYIHPDISALKPSDIDKNSLYVTIDALAWPNSDGNEFQGGFMVYIDAYRIFVSKGRKRAHRQPKPKAYKMQVFCYYIGGAQSRFDAPENADEVAAAFNDAGLMLDSVQLAAELKRSYDLAIRKLESI